MRVSAHNSQRKTNLGTERAGCPRRKREALSLLQPASWHGRPEHVHRSPLVVHIPHGPIFR